MTSGGIQEAIFWILPPLGDTLERPIWSILHQICSIMQNMKTMLSLQSQLISAHGVTKVSSLFLNKSAHHNSHCLPDHIRTPPPPLKRRRHHPRCPATSATDSEFRRKANAEGLRRRQSPAEVRPMTLEFRTSTQNQL